MATIGTWRLSLFDKSAVSAEFLSTPNRLAYGARRDCRRRWSSTNVGLATRAASARGFFSSDANRLRFLAIVPARRRLLNLPATCRFRVFRSRSVTLRPCALLNGFCAVCAREPPQVLAPVRLLDSHGATFPAVLPLGERDTVPILPVMRSSNQIGRNAPVVVA